MAYSSWHFLNLHPPLQVPAWLLVACLAWPAALPVPAGGIGAGQGGHPPLRFRHLQEHASIQILLHNRALGV